MTTQLFLDDTYRQSAPGRVTEITERGGIILDQSLFCAISGGQPGDEGRLLWGSECPMRKIVAPSFASMSPALR